MTIPAFLHFTHCETVYLPPFFIIIFYFKKMVSSIITWLILIKYTNVAYSYLVTIMGLVIPWSFTLALVDGYSVLVKCPIRQPGIVLIIVIGDWVRII